MERRFALDVALDMMQRPLLAKNAQRTPLPEGVLQLIRIAAGSEEDIVWASRTRARADAEIREAAVTILQQVLFCPGADNFRLLGLGSSATAEELHEHRRWLLKWLHPDRNPNKWESQLFQRVSQAARAVQESLTHGHPERAASISPQRRRRHHSRAVRRPIPMLERTAPSWRAWTMRQLRRTCYLVFIVGAIAIGWRLWDGQPIGQALADLSSGQALWLDW
jgi:hypothetical protein